MERDLPVYLLGPPGDEAEGFPPGVRRVIDPLDFPGEEDDPGWVLVSSRVDAGPVIDLVRRLGRVDAPWSLILLEAAGGEDGPVRRALPLSPGVSLPLNAALELIRRGTPQASLLSLRLLLKDLSRIRHDMNNPLTAALAEVQLLLMDAEPDSELEQNLQVVEAQLKRLGEMVANLVAIRHSRPPRM